MTRRRRRVGLGRLWGRRAVLERLGLLGLAAALGLPAARRRPAGPRLHPASFWRPA